MLFFCSVLNGSCTQVKVASRSEQQQSVTVYLTVTEVLKVCECLLRELAEVFFYDEIQARF